MSEVKSRSLVERFFFKVVEHPWKAIAAGFLAIVLTGAGLTNLVKDPSTDSLIPPAHESIAASDYAEEVFGLADPIVVAVSSDDPQGIFTPSGLETVKAIHDYLAGHQNIRPDRIVSIASESRIYGTEDALHVDRFYEDAPNSQNQADAIRRAVFASPPHIGAIVAEDGSGALIVAEFFDESLAGRTYEDVQAYAGELEASNLQINVAGQGAVTGYLSKSIDKDSRRLPPIAALVVFALIWLAFGHAKALLAPLFVTLATVAGAIGIMAWFGIPYYVITGALPVILIAISVADSIHILTGYYERRAADPIAPTSDIVVSTMEDLWRPLTLTTFTTIAGFVGIGIASVMPPMVWFGWFAALGVFIAWLASMLVLPAILLKLNLAPSPRVQPGQYGVISDALTRLSQGVAARPFRALGALGLVCLIGVMFANLVVADNSRISNFSEGQPIRVADNVLNTQFSGTAYLDVIVETPDRDGLVSVDAMTRIENLQKFLETQPYVRKTTSIVDYVSQLHVALSNDALNSLPSDDNAIAQYLLLYEMSGNPSDLEDEIDTDYQRAFVRAYMNADLTSEQTPTLEALEAYLVNEFNTADINGTISGRVNIDYHWMQQLVKSHTRSVALSLIFVFVIAALLFRSFLLGFIALAPVLVALIAVYGVMGAFGIFIEPGTSMFAAIAIGIGVDFSIHFIDRLQKGLKDDGLSIADAIAQRYPASTRACFLNGATLAIGFSVLMVSELPPVFKLGLLIAIAAAASFFGGLVIATATTALFASGSLQSRASVKVASLAAALLVGGVLVTNGQGARADEASVSIGGNMDGRAIAEQIDARTDGDHMKRAITMELIDRRGRSRVREAVVYRREKTKMTQSVIYYTAPSALRDTAFLTHDKLESTKDDRQWLFLPAANRSKQIPSSDRGAYFLGTDFTYEDIRSELKFDLTDYHFERLDSLATDPEGTVRLSATPQTDQIAAELGYGEVRSLIDTKTWIPQSIEFDDPRGRPLKTIRIMNVEQIDGIWTPLRIEADNTQDEHKTIFIYSDVEFGSEQSSRIFSPQGLKQGAP